MHLDVGTVVWIILVVIGVFSSLINKAKKVAQQAQPASSPGAPVRSIAQAIPVHEQSFAPVEPVAAPPAIVIKRPERKKVAESAALIQPAVVQQDGTKPFRGMFDRANLANAFIAAQVFGPPKALQEQSIWSPRHNEPSI